MESNFYQFNVGNFKFMSISDGGHYYPLGALFSNVPQVQVEHPWITNRQNFYPLHLSFRG
jgi:hypothetical protein